MNGITRNSSSMQVTLGAGSRHVLVVGRYRETGDAYDGYANQPMTGCTPYSGQNVSISPSSYASNPFFGIFTTSIDTVALNFTARIGQTLVLYIQNKKRPYGLF